MDLTFFLQGVTAWELIRTGVISGIVFWTLHQLIIKRDIQQLVDSNEEIKNQLTEMKGDVEEQIEKELRPFRELPTEVKLLHAEIKNLGKTIAIVHNLKEKLPIHIDE
jgi:hypothetical protein